MTAMSDPQMQGFDFGGDECVAFGDSITANRRARVLFKRGLAFMLGYNHEEAIGHFQAAIAADANCAMA